jgi:hypothetical protein
MLRFDLCLGKKCLQSSPVLQMVFLRVINVSFGLTKIKQAPPPSPATHKHTHDNYMSPDYTCEASTLKNSLFSLKCNFIAHIHPVYGNGVQTHDPLVMSQLPYPIDQRIFALLNMLLFESLNLAHWFFFENEIIQI